MILGVQNLVSFSSEYACLLPFLLSGKAAAHEAAVVTEAAVAEAAVAEAVVTEAAEAQRPCVLDSVCKGHSVP